MSESQGRSKARPQSKANLQSRGEVNEVRLIGRVTSEPEDRTLPSGAHLTTLRVSVRRAPTTMTRGSAQLIDVVDCVAWSAQARRAASLREVGDTVEVRGSLRRPFFRTPGGVASRTEVEVLTLRVVKPTS